MEVTIIGLGLIGGSIAMDLRRSHFATRLTGVEENPVHAKEAIERNLVDRILNIKEALLNTDIVIIAIPVDKIISLLPYVLSNIPEGTTVTDVGSTKLEIAKAVENHTNRRNYVPSHPMSGTEYSGPMAAKEGLFKEKIAIICDHKKSAPQHLALIEKMYQSLEMNIAYMSSDEQDHSTAFISHLPHAVAFALANAVLAKENRSIIFDLASGGFRSTVRLAKSAPSMWGPIFKQNKSYILEAMDTYIKHFIELRESIEKNEDEMYKLMTNANKIKDIVDGKSSYMIKDEKRIIKYFTK